MQTALAGLLKSIAGRYVKLTSSDLGVGINGGHLVVENVELRVAPLNAALDGFPMQILSGRASRLRVDVPWSALSSSPVLVSLDGLYLIAGPINSEAPGPGASAGSRSEKKPTPTRPDKYSSRQARKRSNSRSSHDPKFSDTDLDRQLEELGEKWHSTLLGRLLFNVTVEIRGLSLAYEDDQCRAVLRLEELGAQSVGRNWKPAFVPLDSSFRSALAMRKRFQLSGLTLRCQDREKLLKTNDGKLRSGEEKPDDSGEISEQFEAVWPVLDNIGLEVKVQMCCRGEQAEELHDAIAVEIDVEIDDPVLSISSRQLKWLLAILSRSRQAPMSGESESSDLSEGELNEVPERETTHKKKRGPLGSLWNFIVGENGFEIRDDAADVLGFDGMDALGADEQAAIEEAVRLAAEAGGSTFKIRVSTPDRNARKEIRNLRVALDSERKGKERLEDAERVVREADHRMAEIDREIENLLCKNAALTAELRDLEEMTAESSRNKDAMIRQMEAALVQAERNLQAALQREIDTSEPRGNRRASAPASDKRPSSSGSAGRSRRSPRAPSQGSVVGRPRGSKSTRESKRNKDKGGDGLTMM